jgi:hypothetical protein
VPLSKLPFYDSIERRTGPPGTAGHQGSGGVNDHSFRYELVLVGFASDWRYSVENVLIWPGPRVCTDHRQIMCACVGEECSPRRDPWGEEDDA